MSRTSATFVNSRFVRGWPLRLTLLALMMALAAPTDAQRRRRGSRTAGFWIQEDLAAARQEARRTGKPLLIVFRCPP